MKRYIVLMGILLLAWGSLHAQGEENYWVFGRGYSLDFSTVPPTLVDVRPSLETYSYHNSIAVSNAAGQLQLFVHLWAEHLRDGTSAQIFDRFGNPVPNSNLMGSQVHAGPPIVIPHGGNPNQYYIFYTRDRALFYTLFDMSLRNGLGDIVPGEKNRMISGYGTVSGGRKTAIQGCSGVWLVIRSHHSNEYYSYLVGRNGLRTEPIVSEAGLNPLLSYQIDEAVLLAASPDGKTMVTGFGVNDAFNLPGGIELYDFEKCSGKVKNTRILESGITTFGYCFSPDNSKLYVSQNDNPTPTGIRHAQGYVYQYDLSQPSLASIAASKTLILSNPYTIEEHWPYGCNVNMHIGLGDIKAGPDGKLYLLNQSPVTCRENSSPLPLPSPLTHNPGMAFHVIHNPNAVGLACNPSINEIFNSVNGMVSGFGHGGRATLPTDFIKHPLLPDTMIGTTHNMGVCYKDSLLLLAPDGMSCYLWDNGQESKEHMAAAPGVYFVHYYTPDCRIVVDTYRLHHVPLPDIPMLTHGCPGKISIAIRNKEGDSTNYTYTLTGQPGRTFSGSSNAGYNFYGLGGGAWQLRVTTASGCDTTLTLALEEYPKPYMTTQPEDTTIKYGDTIQLHAEGAMMYTWWPNGALDTHNVADPLAAPKDPTLFTVIGWNEYGCKDTGFVNVNIDYTMQVFIPNAFTPNNDGLNDVFQIEHLSYQRIVTFRIFNRYGQEVFACHTLDCGWDGTSGGQPVDAGVYFYYIELAYPDGRIENHKGDVTLIR